VESQQIFLKKTGARNVLFIIVRPSNKESKNNMVTLLIREIERILSPASMRAGWVESIDRVQITRLGDKGIKGIKER
jgi:hypothetical protein